MTIKTRDKPSRKISDANDTTATTRGNAENDPIPADIRLLARAYRERGWHPITLKPRTKIPTGKRWSQIVTSDNTKWVGNIGVLLGVPSGGLTDLDLDCIEARLLAAAILPRTNAKFGRPGSPNSHWFYDCGDAAPAAATTGNRFAPGFGNEKSKPLLEVRSTGGQTMCPPSIHPNGEQLEWAEYGESGKVDVAELIRAASVLAAASLLFRHFPGEGQRFDAYKAMTGALLRCDVDKETIKAIIGVFTDNFESTKARARRQSVDALAGRLERGNDNVPGFPKLEEVFGKEVARKCKEWLRTGAEWEVNTNGVIVPSLNNMVLALTRLEVRLRYNEYADQRLVSIGSAAEEKLEDQLVTRLYFMLEEEFRFSGTGRPRP